MSRPAVEWASRMRPAYPADKLVLWALADMANDRTLLAFPSVAALVEFTGLERKRVMTSVARLASMRLIEDTGERIGKTKQVRVWRIIMTDETVPWADPLAVIIRA